MQSSKVSPGDTATAAQYNNVREDAMQAGYYLVETLSNDDTLIISEAIVGDAASVLFAAGKSSIGYFEVQIPEMIDTSEDWLFKMGYDMNTSDAGKQVYMQLDYAVIDDAGDTTPAAYTATKNEILTTPDTIETQDVHTFSTIKIDAADLVVGSILTCKITRLGSDGNDTHDGDLRCLTLEMFQNQT
jgi:hypothetical protein